MSCRLLAATLLLVVPAFAGTNNTIVVSATRLNDLDLMDMSFAADVTVIDRAVIEQSGAVAIPDLLEKQANVLVRGQGGNASDGQLSMRGFGDNSQLRVLVLVDGHKINRPDMGGIDWQSLPVSNIERIEVIRGGQTVLYGNHALSGVVKITTKKGEDAGGQLSGSLGSQGYIGGSASYGGSLADTDYLLGVSSERFEGFRTNSATSSTTYNGSIGWYANNTDTVTFRGSLSESDSEFPGVLTYEQMQRDPTQSNALGNDHSNEDSGLATLLYETERAWGAARFNTGFNYRDLSSSLGGNFSQNDQIGVSFEPRARIGSEEDFWMAGFDFYYDGLDVDNYLDESRDIRKSWADLDRITAAPYVFAQRTLAAKTILSGGVRYEYAGTDNTYNQYVESQLSPVLDTNRGPIPNPNYKNPPDIDPVASFDGRVEKQGWAAELSISRELSEELSVFAGYDRVYRYPTLDEAAAYQGYPLSDPLNEDLDPERGNNFELGSTFENRQWRISLTGFCLLLDNEIAFDDMAKLNRNMGSTRRLGSEAEMAWANIWYGASTRWTFVDARIDGGLNDGNRVPLVPWAYGMSSAWIEPFPEVRLTVSYSCVSSQYQGNDEANRQRKLDAYGLVGFRVNVRLSDQASLYFLMDNLFDETYATAAYSGGFYPGSGRSCRCGLTMVF